MGQLKGLKNMMNIAHIAKTVLNHRKTMSPTKVVSVDNVSGHFDITLCFAENVKPTNKNGLSSPYVVLRVPEGTIQPPAENLALTRTTPDDKSPEIKTAPDVGPVELHGTQCELFRYL
jgi:hypothetical protein